jgi:hypothetical protein
VFLRSELSLPVVEMDLNNSTDFGSERVLNILATVRLLFFDALVPVEVLILVFCCLDLKFAELYIHL